MRQNWPILIDVIILAVIASLAVFLYQKYHHDIAAYLFASDKVNIYVRNIPLTVTIADTEEERSRGLGGVGKLPADQGMLFIFERSGDYLFWMKDTLIPLDIFWIDDELKVVHIERNVRPESYPARYGSPAPARFVLETNAFFADTFSIAPGDTLAIPASWLPADLR